MEKLVQNSNSKKIKYHKNLKGVILAGGNGTRLMPMTRVTNKHLLPVYDRPMVHFPIECLRLAGIDEILLVTGGEYAGAFMELLGNGKDFGLHELAYAYQEGAGGIAAALALAEDFADGQSLVVVLGDNIMQNSLTPIVNEYRSQLEKNNGTGARIVLNKTKEAFRFGVAKFADNNVNDKLLEIIEKPKNPPSNMAVIGFYMYDARVFDIIRTLKPSSRDELEITDVNNRYLEWGELEYSILAGKWTDAGTVDSLFIAGQLVRDLGANGQRVD